jgi:predicted DNA-binding transcriptional regulator AlpA
MKFSINGIDYIDSEEVAKRMEISSTTLKVRTRAKEIPLPIKLKSRVFWKESEIDEYLEKTREGKE